MTWWQYGVIVWVLFILVILRIGYVRAERREAEKRAIIREIGICQHGKLGPAHWTQDGFVRVCRQCGEWTYLGESYDG